MFVTVEAGGWVNTVSLYKKNLQKTETVQGTRETSPKIIINISRAL